MFGMIGIVVIFVMVFGGYMLAGGKLGIILKAMPFEMVMIGGAAIGTFFVANDFPAVKRTGKDLKKVFQGPKWQAKCPIPDVCIDERRLPLFIARATLRELIAGLEARAFGGATR